MMAFVRSGFVITLFLTKAIWVFAQEPPLPIGLGEEQVSAQPVETPVQSRRLHGFWETRLGLRTRGNQAQSGDSSLVETRLQLKWEKSWDKLVLETRGDFYLDGVSESAEFDLRQFRLLFRPIESLDISVGRQVITWGAADQLFINDLFPKDWQSFLLGRDVGYLKAPTDAVRISWRNKLMNLDLVYAPQFTPDRYVTGERISFWDPLTQDFAGEDEELDFSVPSSWFANDEWALRLYRNFGSYELAFYGYSGYWKSNGGQRLFPRQVTFPRLNVYGASFRGPIGKGIGSLEIGYYDSVDDSSGSNPLVNNSEFRFLIGYEQELAKDFTGSFQYYLEHMVDYDNYRRTNFIGPNRDQDRHVVTSRLTKFWLNQDLETSLFAFYSPSDQDGYLRPKVSYRINDNWKVDVGANIFWGNDNHTTFGQLEENSNVYASWRYSF
ncbi:MAG: hypothetical protein CMI53_02310 [Parcubacteria group bacterium]|jgi:hypothetical protein|nr:hypothetical protein [Parcubacteria group bacterium]|tara:strand:+ start:11002 stop:12318 length:1317 start_codon:yes stop_codon:yes gene_type:complete